MQRVPVPPQVLDRPLPDRPGLGDLLEELLQVGHLDVGFEVRDSPAGVAGNQVQQLFGLRREAPDAQVGAQDDDRDAHTLEHVVQFVVELAQLEVAVLQLLVERRELFVGGLELLLGGFQLFVRAL